MDKRLHTRGNVWWICAAALACTTAMAGDPSCDKRPAKKVIVADILLTGPRPEEGTTPVFYTCATDGWNRICVRPDDVLRTIDGITVNYLVSDLLKRGRVSVGSVQ